MRLRPALALLVMAGLLKPARASGPPSALREEAYRANNLGVALLEQFRHAEAAEAFRRALATDPSLAMARFNLAVALFNVPDLSRARPEATAATERMPEDPHPHYLLGLIARGEGRGADAKAAFRKVLALDPADVGAQINLGQLHLQERAYPEAVAAFRGALAAEPYNATAAYNLGLALTRSGQPDEGRRMMERFQKLREGGTGTTIGQSYPEQGRYAEAIASTGAEPDLVDAATPPARFVDVTAARLPAGPAGAREARGAQTPFGRRFPARPLTEADKKDVLDGLGGQVVLFDYDGDGSLDLYEVGPQGQRFYRNQGGVLQDRTRGLGFDPGKGGVGAVAGDYDNDGRPDLFVLRHGGGTLHRNEAERGFTDVTAAAGIPADRHLSVSAAFVDFDHDGDVDLFLPGLADLDGPAGPAVFPDDFAGAPSRLLRNNGNGTFQEIAEAAGLAEKHLHAAAVVATDYDNRRDVDLLVVAHGGAPRLYRNLRDGTFRDVAEEAGLRARGRFRCAAAADVNKDSFTDFFLGVADGPDLLALSDGKGRFLVSAAPEGSSGTRVAQFLDYDNDGLLDLLTLSARGHRLLRNLGAGWADVSGSALPGQDAALAEAALGLGDIDGDSDTDAVLRLPTGTLRVWENRGGDRNASLGVRLEGLVSNRSGVGAKVEVRAGSLRQKLETYSSTPPPAPFDIVFGLGRRPGADAVRVLWPAGILQTEIVAAGGEKRAALAVVVVIKELDRKPSSCPYLYAWDGRRFEFVTDFMGGGEMGYWQGPGQWNHPDPVEYVRLRDDQLQPREGRYEVRVTNELEEALFVDRLALLAVAHPGDVEVHPNEGMVAASRPFRLHAARGARPPRSAVDEHGHDVLPRVSGLDRRYPDDFRLHRIRGYAEEHSLTLDLGDVPGDRALLLLTGWTDYAFSSDNVAAHQAGLRMRPPELQVEDGEGRWRTAVPEVGIPVGRPQTVVVDLGGKWLGRSRKVRIVTNMRIYWDQALVAGAAEAPLKPFTLEAVAAELRERGFSAEASPDGREPFGYDYERVSRASPWKAMSGRYTRVGDVRELLLRSDDMFVISRPGDEIALSFDATALPPLPAGWRRTFLVYSDGFSKEMDINSARPDSVDPLPFHGMTRYPYSPPESYPLTPERQAYIERYNTRRVGFPVPPLELALAERTLR